MKLPSVSDALASIVERSVYIPPHPLMDLLFAAECVEELVLRTENLDEAARDMLLMFRAGCWDLLTRATTAHVPPSNVPPSHTTQGVIGKPGV